MYNNMNSVHMKYQKGLSMQHRQINHKSIVCDGRDGMDTEHSRPRTQQQKATIRSTIKLSYSNSQHDELPTILGHRDHHPSMPLDAAPIILPHPRGILRLPKHPTGKYWKPHLRDMGCRPIEHSSKPGVIGLARR